jgi:hypothetical protein
MDFVLAILPWHVVMGLNMRRKEKITIACGLSLGVVAGACSVVRTIELRLRYSAYASLVFLRDLSYGYMRLHPRPATPLCSHGLRIAWKSVE